jgi:FkbM family methyltransferase
MRGPKEDVDVELPWLLARLVHAPWPAKRWVAEHPLAWRYYTGVCRRIGWDDTRLGWHTPVNGPFAGIRTRSLHANHVWVPAGIYELGVSRCLIDLIRDARGWTDIVHVWDVGANHGRMSLLCARHGASHVIAIEPLQTNLAVFRQYLEANPRLAGRVEIVRAAAADRVGTIEFTIDESDGAVGQIRSTGVAAYEFTGPISVQSVPCTTLDALRNERRPPAIVKIDVEGAEALVLRGAAELLTLDRPVVLVEIHNAEAGRESLAMLRASGYQCEQLDRRGHARRAGSEFSYGHILARAD